MPGSPPSCARPFHPTSSRSSSSTTGPPTTRRPISMGLAARYENLVVSPRRTLRMGWSAAQHRHQARPRRVHPVHRGPRRPVVTGRTASAGGDGATQPFGHRPRESGQRLSRCRAGALSREQGPLHDPRRTAHLVAHATRDLSVERSLPSTDRVPPGDPAPRGPALRRQGLLRGSGDIDPRRRALLLLYFRRSDAGNAGARRLDPAGYYANLREVLDVVVANTAHRAGNARASSADSPGTS